VTGLEGAPAVVALGGGHGLAAALQALRRITDRPTAVVTVADDGGSSGRLRRELGVLPPGDLRMALAALCGDDEWGRTWSEVVQHRFRSEGELHEHSLGNLLIVALWELLDDSVSGLDWVARLLGVQGRVLPMSVVPLDIEAEVSFPGAGPGAPDELALVRGQVAVATTAGRVRSVRLLPENPPACPQAVEAVLAADWVVLGPGSWFTSVLPHLLVPELAAALRTTSARKLVALNLSAQPGETDGFTPAEHVEVLARHAPDLEIDIVLADPAGVADRAALEAAAALLGAEVELAALARDDHPDQHDPDRLATALRRLFAPARHPSDRI
jgi:uncharacterized cofD-like protein